MLKFRAWHKEEKHMGNIINIDFFNETIGVPLRYEPGFYDSYAFHEVELMQWTGLEDRQHKHIYEGDLVRIMEFDIIKPIIFYNGRYGYDMWSPVLGYEEFNDLGKHLWSRLEIIGNIYENPELLEENNGRN